MQLLGYNLTFLQNSFSGLFFQQLLLELFHFAEQLEQERNANEKNEYRREPVPEFHRNIGEQIFMFERGIEDEIIPLGEKKGIGQVVYSPLAQGVLTGKYASREDVPENSRASKLGSDRLKISEERISQVQALGHIADELGISVGQLALAWILRQGNVSSALVGASRPEQVEENVNASGIKLSSDTLTAIEDILKK